MKTILTTIFAIAVMVIDSAPHTSARFVQQSNGGATHPQEADAQAGIIDTTGTENRSRTGHN